jgi:D-alanyl-D-alanine-carboxypeptidase/D-alanyl-D-alanine-endopeptidase
LNDIEGDATTMNPRSMLALALVGVLAAPSRADHPPAAVSAIVAEALDPLIESGKVVGMTVGVVDGDRTYVFGLGRIDKRFSAVPDGKTLYEIGSISKVFTGILLAELAERGEVALDEPVARLLPDGVSVPERNGKCITLEHLATHASGLPRIPTNLKLNLADPYKGYEPDDLYAFLGKCTLNCDPGETADYSNLGMGLLGFALQRRAGMASYEALVADRIAGPLGLSDTRVRLGDALRERLAPGYSPRLRPVSNWEVLTLAGAGGVRSTMDDMIKFANFCMNPDDTTLGRAVRESQRPRRDFREGGDRLGLAWLVREDGTFFHNGQTGGYHAFLGLRPDRGVGVVILANTATDAVDDAGGKALDRLAAQAKAREPR